MAINTTRNEVTGETPFFVVHGREFMRNGYFHCLVQKKGDVLKISKGEWMSKMSELYEKVERRMEEAREKNARRYNLRAKVLKF